MQALVYLSNGYFLFGSQMAHFDSRSPWKQTKNYTENAFFPDRKSPPPTWSVFVLSKPENLHNWKQSAQTASVVPVTFGIWVGSILGQKLKGLTFSVSWMLQLHKKPIVGSHPKPNPYSELQFLLNFLFALLFTQFVEKLYIGVVKGSISPFKSQCTIGVRWARANPLTSCKPRSSSS